MAKVKALKLNDLFPLPNLLLPIPNRSSLNNEFYQYKSLIFIYDS